MRTHSECSSDIAGITAFIAIPPDITTSCRRRIGNDIPRTGGHRFRDNCWATSESTGTHGCLTDRSVSTGVEFAQTMAGLTEQALADMTRIANAKWRRKFS
jgi:hypothetical protein